MMVLAVAASDPLTASAHHHPKDSPANEQPGTSYNTIEMNPSEHVQST